jgi:hypothetical protein
MDPFQMASLEDNGCWTRTIDHSKGHHRPDSQHTANGSLPIDGSTRKIHVSTGRNINVGSYRNDRLAVVMREVFFVGHSLRKSTIAELIEQFDTKRKFIQRAMLKF